MPPAIQRALLRVRKDQQSVKWSSLTYIQRWTYMNLVSALAVLAFPPLFIGGLWKLGTNRQRAKGDGILVLIFTSIGMLLLAYGVHLKASMGDQLFGRGALEKSVTSWFQIVGFSVVSFVAAGRLCIRKNTVKNESNKSVQTRPTSGPV